MTRLLNARFLALAALTVALAGCNSFSTAKTTPVAGAMMGDKPVDDALAQRGATIYLTKGCYTCHSIGAGKRAAPDLIGITDRRDHTWLRAWLLNTDSMINSADPQVKAMMEEWKGIKMPQIPLNDNDIQPLFHYMAQESARVRAKQGSD